MQNNCLHGFYYGFRAIILHTFGGLGKAFRVQVLKTYEPNLSNARITGNCCPVISNLILLWEV